MSRHVQVITNDGRATFTLAVETDPEEGTIDLTPMLETLVAVGIAHPHCDTKDSVPFGTLETEGDIVAVVDGRTLTGTELAEALGAGLVHTICLAIDIESARTDAEDTRVRQSAAEAGEPDTLPDTLPAARPQ